MGSQIKFSEGKFSIEQVIFVFLRQMSFEIIFGAKLQKFSFQRQRALNYTGSKKNKMVLPQLKTLFHLLTFIYFATVTVF
jgi:hypothetical protein